MTKPASPNYKNVFVIEDPTFGKTAGGTKQVTLTKVDLKEFAPGTRVVVKVIDHNHKQVVVNVRKALKREIAEYNSRPVSHNETERLYTVSTDNRVNVILP